MSDSYVGRIAVEIVMGSSTDWSVLAGAANLLQELSIQHNCEVISAHRMPDDMFRFAETAWDRGVRVIIAGAGGAAHLPGMLAAKTTVPVLGVPIPSKHLQGVDSLYSIVQMPKGIPVATFAIGEAGAVNAALFAAAMLARENPKLHERLLAYRQKQTEAARAMTKDLT